MPVTLPWLWDIQRTTYNLLVGLIKDFLSYAIFKGHLRGCLKLIHNAKKDYIRGYVGVI
jgi:hypothetical protein